MTGINISRVLVLLAGGIAAASLLSVVISAPAEATVTTSFQKRCVGVRGPNIRIIPGVKNSCGGQALNWCTPPGYPATVGARDCGPPGPELYAAWAAYNASHGGAPRRATARRDRSTPERTTTSESSPSSGKTSDGTSAQ